jgi:signal transduction histidine kinase
VTGSGRRAQESRSAAVRLPFGSLRSKLRLFAVALVIVPGIVIALITVSRARSALEQAVGRQLAEVAHDTVEQLGTAIAVERANLGRWARHDVMEDVQAGDPDGRVAGFLRSLRDSGAPYLDVLAVDSDGRVVAATDPAEVSRVLRDHAWTRETLAGKEYIAGPVVAAPPDERWLEIAVPIRARDNSVRGALLGRYQWTKAISLGERIRHMQLPHGLSVDILLFDVAGHALGEWWREGIAEGQRRGLRERAAVLAERLRSAPVPGHIEATNALVGYDRGEGRGVGWLALVMEPVEEAFRPVREMERRLALGLIGVVLAALLVSTYLADRMSRPLRELMRATREVGRSRAFRMEVAVRSRDEIGELAFAFNTMTAQLAQAQDDLLTAAKFAFLGEVAAGVAHEVRTPLGIVRSSAQMLQRSLPAKDGDAAELIDMMIEEVDRLDRVVDGLLELARPHEPVVESTALDEVLARALDFVEAQAREKNIALTREFGAAPTIARCDPEQIYQTALNLIVNALQILPPGGRIVVRTCAMRDGRVGFEVADDGPGIPPEVRDRIFTPFFSLRKGGTGLGLALVQRFVQGNGGTVTLENATRGATFRVELPGAGSDA